MALRRCATCKGGVGLLAKTCPHCGAKTSRAKLFLGAIIFGQAMTLAALFNPWQHGRGEPGGGIHFVAGVGTSSTATRNSALSGWQYYDSRDELTGDVTRHARLISRGAPSGAQHVGTGIMELQASKLYGRHVALIVNRKDGTVADTPVLQVQIDDQKTLSVPVTVFSDNDSVTLMPRDPAEFTRHLAGAHSMLLEAQLSPSNQQTVSFDVTGLDWD